MVAKFDHYRIIQTRYDFFLFLFCRKGVFYFWQTAEAILEDVTAAKTIIVWCKNISQKISIFQCSKNYPNGNSKHGKPEKSYQITLVPLIRHLSACKFTLRLSSLRSKFNAFDNNIAGILPTNHFRPNAQGKKKRCMISKQSYSVPLQPKLLLHMWVRVV